jgi:hypothetical protein
LKETMDSTFEVLEYLLAKYKRSGSARARLYKAIRRAVSMHHAKMTPNSEGTLFTIIVGSLMEAESGLTERELDAFWESEPKASGVKQKRAKTAKKQPKESAKAPRGSK